LWPTPSIVPHQLADVAAAQRDGDGGLTLLIQNESPGKDKESNWLPAPKGPFIMYMRLYWPKTKHWRQMDCAAIETRE